jgi:hypothetical protein
MRSVVAPRLRDDPAGSQSLANVVVAFVVLVLVLEEHAD